MAASLLRAAGRRAWPSPRLPASFSSRSAAPEWASSLTSHDARLAAEARRREIEARWKEGGAFLEALKALGRPGSKASAEEVRVLVHVALRRGTVRRAAHVAAALRAMGEKRDSASAAWLLGEARSREIPLDARTFDAALRAFAAAGDEARALEVLEEMETRGPAPTGFSYAAAIRASSDAATDALLARAVASGDEHVGVAFHAALRRAKGDWARAVDLVARRVPAAGVEATDSDYVVALVACQRAGRFEEALEVLARARAAGRDTDMAWTLAVAACGSARRPDVAKKTYERWRAAGRGPGGAVAEALVQYAGPDEAKELLAALVAQGAASLRCVLYAARVNRSDPETVLAYVRTCERDTGEAPDAALCGAVLEALAREAGRSGTALDLLDDMADRDVFVDDRGLAAAVRACGRDGRWREALDLYDGRPLDHAPKAAHAAVDVCARFGRTADATRICLDAPPTDLAIHREAAKASFAKRDYDGLVAIHAHWAGRKAAKPGKRDKALVLDVHGLTVPLALGATLTAVRAHAAAADDDPVPSLVLLTGSRQGPSQKASYLKRDLARALTRDLGLWLGEAKKNDGVLVLPAAALRHHNTTTSTPRRPPEPDAVPF